MISVSAVDAAVELSAVRVNYRARSALVALDLTIRLGEIVGLVGPNGAGKSTTIDVCCGLRRLTAGTARVLGRDCEKPDRELRRSIGLVPQDSGLYLDLTPQENLRLFARLYDIPHGAARIDHLLEVFSLTARAREQVGKLSGGMRRRLALARALLHDPPVLLLDEPTLGVDVHGRRVLWDLVAALRDEGRAVLLATNALDEAAELSDRIVVLDRGVVLADKSPADLLRSAKAATPGREPTLEDVFLGLTGRGLRE
jgi:ABC-type multidrug transport system ATPase subunit